MRQVSVTRRRLSSVPEALVQLGYRGSVDDFADWALIRPSRNPVWVVCIHGHGSTGDQLYTRADIRDLWLRKFLEHDVGIVTPNLRGNAWMGPAAAADLKDVLRFVREEYGALQFVFFGGSMGGTSNLVYAALEPGDVAGLAALGAVPDLAAYHSWLRKRTNGGLFDEIADAIEQAYGGRPEEKPDLYAKHSALENAERLTMPVFLAHGECDPLMPVSHARCLAEKLRKKEDFVYEEIREGGHDAPLVLVSAFDWLMEKVRAR